MEHTYKYFNFAIGRMMVTTIDDRLYRHYKREYEKASKRISSIRRMSIDEYIKTRLVYEYVG